MLTMVVARSVSGRDVSVADGGRRRRDVTLTRGRQMLLHVNATFPTLAVTRRDVRVIHHGVIPAVGIEGGLDLLGESAIVSHATMGVPGLISLAGAKFTTARHAAEHAVNAACVELGRPVGRSRTAETVLPHAGVADAVGRTAGRRRARCRRHARR